MSKFSSAHLRSLIQPDRVHRDVYTDPALFELEMQQLFGKAWLVLGHNSQALPNNCCISSSNSAGSV